MIQILLDSFDAAIFDMDGTMINNMEYHKRAWKAFAKNYGLDLSDNEFREKFSGKKNDQIFQMIFGNSISKKAIADYTDEKEALYRELYAPDIEPIMGLHELINKLQRAEKKLAVATTAPKANRDFGFRALHLDNTFEVVLGDEDVTKGKPHPEIYEETAKLLHVEPVRCLVFEDSPPGVQSGKNAGMKVIGIMTTHSAEEIRLADYKINNFSEINFI